MNKSELLITVFTPTYNRAHTLSKLFESLTQQTYKYFEWLIVDDGSSDNTKEVVNSFIDKGLINIKFISKQNEGKHVAINTGAQHALGELFFTVDSDDYLTPNSLERICYHWNEVQKLPISERKWLIGVSGHRMYPGGKIIGGEVNYDVLDIDLLDFRFKLNIKGDKAEVYLTSVIKKNPFPKIEGENFCSEALVFYRLANEGYKLRQFNEGIYFGEYLEGGLTKTSLQSIKKNIKGALLSYADMVHFSKLSFFIRVKYAILFWRFSFWASTYTISQKIALLPNWFYILFFPIGFLMYLKDKRSIETNKNSK